MIVIFIDDLQDLIVQMRANSPKAILDSTILLAVIPALIYLSAYFYEAIQCAMLKIPQFYIAMDFNIMLSFSYRFFLLSLIAVTIIFMIFYGLSILVKFENAIWFFIGINAMLIGVAYLLVQFFYANSGNNYIIAGSVILILNLITCLLVYLSIRHEKAMLKVKDASLIAISPFSEITKLFKRTHILLIICLILFPIYGGIIGIYALENKSYYNFILNDKEKLIVLKKYGEVLICAHYYPKKNQISDTLTIIKTDKLEKLSIKEYLIHPLVFDKR